VQSNPTRRAFLGTTAATAAAGWIAAKPYAAGAPASPGPNETVHLALIGCGPRGCQLVDIFKPLAGARFVAACDVEASRLAKARRQAGGDAVRPYHDFRKLLEDRDVDAVVVASTDNWHCFHTIHACRAGKDVYVEKPLGNSIAEGRAAVRAAHGCDRVVQFGTQQRSWEHYRKAVEIIRSGRLGEISEVKVWDAFNDYPGYGSPPDCDPPDGFDWDLWLGPAPEVPYNPNRHRNWRWFFDYGGGWQVRWSVHHYDVVNWAMGVAGPVSAVGMGDNMCFEPTNTQWPDTFSGICQYGPGPVAEKGFLLQLTVRNGCRREHRSHCKLFCGTDASMILDRSGYTIMPEPAGRKKGLAEESSRSSGENHAQVFLDNVRNHTKPFADVEQGHLATIPGHLMNVSWRVGRRIRWDAEKERILGDDEADALLTRPIRPPWSMEG
jgi:predicted dehydrogenase